MSWSIDIEGVINVKESIVSMCCCEGNLALATEKVGYDKLPHIVGSENAIAAILKVIEEVDKNNDGLFNDDWCAACDIKWSNGREMKEAWGKWEPLFSNLQGRGELNLPFKDEKTYWGNKQRTNLREAAVRFYLYYKSGFKITFEW